MKHSVEIGRRRQINWDPAVNAQSHPHSLAGGDAPSPDEFPCLFIFITRSASLRHLEHTQQTLLGEVFGFSLQKAAGNKK